MAGALGLGLRPGDVAVSIGTSGTVYTVSDAPTADPSGAVAGFADASGRHLPLVCTLNASKVSDAVARLLGVDHTGLDELVLATAPGAGGLTLLPYLDGERTPNRPSATGVLTGLRSNVTREQLARAAVEGVVCGLLDGLDALARFAPVDGRLLLAGGGAHSRAYRQVLADLSGRAVLVPRSDQQVATGRACRRRRSPPARTRRTSPTGGGWVRGTRSSQAPERRARPTCALPTTRFVMPTSPDERPHTGAVASAASCRRDRPSRARRPRPSATGRPHRPATGRAPLLALPRRCRRAPTPAARRRDPRRS